MIIRTIDVETTGLPPDAAVVEFGWTDLEVGGMTLAGPFSALVNPGRSIPPEISAIHHIRDRDLEGKPPPDRVMARLVDGADIFCAHKADFERSFFGGGGKPWICTWKAALRVWPDAPGHSNQILRYWLGLDLDERAMPPHRAGPDSFVSAHVLARLLAKTTATIPDVLPLLAVWADKPALLVNCEFGKHRGAKWRDVPADYLDWIVRKSDMDDPDLLFTARHYLRQGKAAA